MATKGNAPVPTRSKSSRGGAGKAHGRQADARKRKMAGSLYFSELAKRKAKAAKKPQGRPKAAKPRQLKMAGPHVRDVANNVFVRLSAHAVRAANLLATRRLDAYLGRAATRAEILAEIRAEIRPGS